MKSELLVAFNEMIRPQKPFWSVYNMNLVQRPAALLYQVLAMHWGIYKLEMQSWV